MMQVSDYEAIEDGANIAFYAGGDLLFMVPREFVQGKGAASHFVRIWKESYKEGKAAGRLSLKKDISRLLNPSKD